ncbi:hypothetical protein [Thermofilum pendens]|uniref:Uncharacterized protein n=1 Tax=Thermofilum pendens (strain DSM 2475 / Hrk 5) TaxID=368408 RepID=A1RW64_THEPD|nr:hypothetical protein [Thermofilum pendens]ABL77444.1 hypothetical protein Tpen_0034 [Thermofilum pendens Hrk 5]
METGKNVEEVVLRVSEELERFGLKNIVSEDSRTLIVLLDVAEGKEVPVLTTFSEESFSIVVPVNASVSELEERLSGLGGKVHTMDLGENLAGIVVEAEGLPGAEELAGKLREVGRLLESLLSSEKVGVCCSGEVLVEA